MAGGFTAHHVPMFPLINYEATRTLVDERIGDLRRAAGEDTHPTRRRPPARRRNPYHWFR